MSAIGKYIVCILLLHITIFQSNCSFIDINQPIIIRDNNAGANYFSYSIAATSPSSAGLQSKIIIGAPKVNSSQGLESGLVWECKLELAEANTVYCSILPISVEPQQKSGYPECCPQQGIQYKQPRCYKEIQEKMWLGNAITSINNGNEFVSCGYRWKTQEKDSTSRRLSGICYHVSISDIKGGGSNLITKRLKPPLHPDDQFTPVAGNSGTNDHLWFYGEYGFSSTFEPRRNLLLIGAPGHFHWKGTVILYEGFNNNKDLPCLGSSSVNALKSQGETMDYLGYAVTSGNYYLPNEFVFAVGAPRGRLASSKHFLNGYVAILTVINSSQYTRSQIVYTEWIFGTQFGSYFGSVLASADVNGDGLQELIIGAPFYNTRYSSDSFDEGCVFIYTNKGTTRRGLRFSERLCPNRDKGGRFGSAITNMGDINHDGFQDIAISAPASRGGFGEVYIFYGSLNKLSDNPKLPIIIYAGDLSSELKGFGLTLIGNVDIDGNKTPDLIIGSYMSKQLVVYRTRPRLDISIQIISYVINKQRIEKFKREENSFAINVCVTIERIPDLDGTLNVWVEITADSDRTGNARFQFVESSSRILLFPISVSKGQCTAREIKVQLVRDLHPEDTQKIAFHWKVWYNDTSNLAKDIRQFDISGNQAGKVVPAKRQFCSYCPAPVTKEFTSSFPLANDNCDSDGNPICSSQLNTNVRLIGESNTNEDLKAYIIGSEDSRFLEIVVTNVKETAYAPTVELTVNFKSETTAKNVQIFLHEEYQGCLQLSGILSELKEENLYRCEIPLHHSKTMILKFRLRFGNLRAMRSDEEITFDISVYPQLHPEQKKKSSAKLTLKSDFKLQFKESPNEPGAAVNAISLSNPDVVQSFVNSYKAENSGLSPLELVTLTFKIPVNRTIDGKEEAVLRIAEPRPKELACTTTDPMGFASFENTVISVTNLGDMPELNSTRPVVARKRRRRETVNDQAKTKTNSIISGDKTVKIGCDAPSDWKCVTVTCLVTIPLESKKVMTIDLRLAFVSRIANKLIPQDARHVIVMTSGEASVFDDKQKASSSTRLELAMDDGLPVWIIFVSGVVGIVVFLLLALCLFKCGFFRRKTKEDLQALKARAEEEDLLARNFPNMEQTEEDGFE